MKPSYAVGLIRHTLADAPEVAKVETFAEVGAVGHSWPPHGLRITFNDGAVVYLSSSSAGSITEVLLAQPDEFTPEDLNVPCM